jgi:hypothetical protein
MSHKLGNCCLGEFGYEKAILQPHLGFYLCRTARKVSTKDAVIRVQPHGVHLLMGNKPCVLEAICQKTMLSRTATLVNPVSWSYSPISVRISNMPLFPSHCSH